MFERRFEIFRRHVVNPLLVDGQVHGGLAQGVAQALYEWFAYDADGNLVRGDQVDYNGQPAGYAADPSETITYVDAHDNEILYDALAYKLPPATAPTDRARMQVLALSTVLLGQGIGFVTAGSERLRSKSLDRNSYNSVATALYKRLR